MSARPLKSDETLIAERSRGGFYRRAGVLSDRERETLGLLVDLRDEIAAEMRAEGQGP